MGRPIEECLTHTDIPESVDKVLGLGPKFSVAPKSDKVELLSLVRDTAIKANPAESDRVIECIEALQAKLTGIRRPDLSSVLNSEGPVTKSVEQWQDWWRKQVQDARQDSAAIAKLQRGTGGGRASGFHGRVLQLTGTLRLTGVRPLDYQQ
ncbi:hypothetical protein MTO96_046209, partial [Rhipicephalus appendiculatus]